MRRRDLDKLRALDPKVAAQLEDVLRRREAESHDADPTISEHDASTTVPEVVEATEVCECPPLPPSNHDVDDETLLFCGCSSAELEAEEDEKEKAQTRSQPTPKAEAVDVGALVASAQHDRDDEEANKPACKRSLESQKLPHWHETSTRREDASFEHPSQFAFLRGCDDADLGVRWGWASKHRGRGLSDLDQAVQREVYARCYGLHDVYGLRWEPRVSSWLVEALRTHGVRSRIAHVVMALFEQMIARGRWALRLSASDVRTLYGWSASGWWYAIWLLEEKGLLARVGSIKDQEEYGAAPVQRDTNLYVLGPWWAASWRGRPSPLETALGFASSTSDEGQRVQADLLRLRRRRRRAQNTASRDRNRARYRDLPPKGYTSRALVHTLDRLSKLRTDADARCERAEATAMFRGRIPFRFGETKPSREVALLGVDTSALERAAQAETARLNAGLGSDPGALYRAGAALGRTFESVQFLLPYEDLTALPKGIIEGKISSRGDTHSTPKTGPPRQPTTPRPLASEPSSLSKGDKSDSPRPPCDRAQALEAEARERGSPRTKDPPLRGRPFFEKCHESIFGKP